MGLIHFSIIFIYTHIMFLFFPCICSNFSNVESYFCKLGSDWILYISFVLYSLYYSVFFIIIITFLIYLFSVNIIWKTFNSDAHFFYWKDIYFHILKKIIFASSV
jgi:hypothetical protein